MHTIYLNTERQEKDPGHQKKFMAQLKEAAKIADAKYPKEDGWRIVWIFDHSSCHAAMPDNALDVSKM